MAGYKLTRSSPGCKIKSYGLNHIEEMHPAVDQDRAAYTKILRAPGSAPLSLLHSCPGEVRMIPSRGGPAPSIHVFAPRAQPRRSAAHHHRPAPPKPCGGADGPRHGQATPRDDAPSHTPHAERSSRRGRLAGGPLPTGTHSGRARRPEHQRRPSNQESPTDCRTNFVLCSPIFPLLRDTHEEYAGRQPLGTTKTFARKHNDNPAQT